MESRDYSFRIWLIQPVLALAVLATAVVPTKAIELEFSLVGSTPVPGGVTQLPTIDFGVRPISAKINHPSALMTDAGETLQIDLNVLKSTKSGDTILNSFGDKKMSLIRCTKKLLAEMGLGEAGLYSGTEPGSALGAWYANLIFIDRKKCVLFANEKTLASFLVVDVSRKDLRERLPDIFRDNLRKLLVFEGFPAAAIAAPMADCGEFVFARTQSRSVLGSMNDMAYLYKYEILEGKSVDEAVSLLNQTPFGKIFPIKELKAFVNPIVKSP
ncbi:MAG: hypothetical protein HY401_01595 [Elusimicrobia bacterium]|nr:hypothetical protein [Elusimicrobiota bacterium]